MCVLPETYVYIMSLVLLAYLDSEVTVERFSLLVQHHASILIISSSPIAPKPYTVESIRQVSHHGDTQTNKPLDHDDCGALKTD